MARDVLVVGGKSKDNTAEGLEFDVNKRLRVDAGTHSTKTQYLNDEFTGVKGEIYEVKSDNLHFEVILKFNVDVNVNITMSTRTEDFKEQLTREGAKNYTSKDKMIVIKMKSRYEFHRIQLNSTGKGFVLESITINSHDKEEEESDKEVEEKPRKEILSDYTKTIKAGSNDQFVAKDIEGYLYLLYIIIPQDNTFEYNFTEFDVYASSDFSSTLQDAVIKKPNRKGTTSLKEFRTVVGDRFIITVRNHHETQDKDFQVVMWGVK